MHPSRRNFILSSLGLYLMPSIALAETKKPVFEYISSKLGIDYRAMAPSPLAEMLSQGEVEWMNNAVVDYGEDTPIVWENSLVPEILTGAVAKITIENLRDFTPNMLTKFSVGLHPRDPKYGYLWSIGTNYVARKLAEKSWYFCKIGDDILQ